VTTPVKAPRVTNVEQLPAPEAAPYRMQTGDVLAIKFYNNPELDDEQPVRPDGMISLPFVGQVGAGGRTPGELEQELVDRYTGELASPQVTVIVREYSPQRYYIGGAIADAGTFEIHGPITLAQALQEAGGLLPTARTQQIILIRPDGSGSRAGFAIDMKKVLSGEAPEQMVYLQAQDVVYVPRSRIANVGLFVEQYITNVIPDLPGLGFYLGNRANN
jgi:protein involved in polysaccharide export with SLBB domain